MAKGCMMVTKYFLFLFNLIFFLFGAVIMGFGLWLLLDNQSFLAVLQDSSMALKVASYILIGVGGFSMLMGFLGCLGAIYEVRCLLGLYFACLLLILIAQVTAGALVYFQKDTINDEMSKIVRQVLDNYGKNTTTEQAWDFIQRKMECCGWTGRMDWDRNGVIVNSSQLLFPCSCQNVSLATGGNVSDAGFCEALAADDWPVYDVGCSSSVEGWLLTNLGVILGICLAVAVIELLGMILSICLCKSVTQREDYTKVPKY